MSSSSIIIAIVPIVGIVMGSVVVFFYLLWNHKRKMLLIQTKQYKEPSFDIDTFSLLAGLLLGTVGLCLTVFMVLTIGRGMGLLGGIIPLSIGFALLVFYFSKRRLKN